jgi:hypothetical protein
VRGKELGDWGYQEDRKKDNLGKKEMEKRGVRQKKARRMDAWL